MAVVGEMNYDQMKEVKEFDESKMGVKGLVDSGITSIPRFFHHPLENTFDLKPSAASSNLRAPIIDLLGLNSSNRRSQIIYEVKEACRTWGFFQVINHGIPMQVMEETIEAVRLFHEQPMEMKKKHYGRDGKVSFYSNANLFYSKAANWYDTLRLLLINLEWESVPMVCKKELEVWGEQMKRLGENLMEVLCEGLGVSAGRLKELSCLDPRAMSCHYYPYCPQPDKTLGLNSHTDKLVLTLLLRSNSNESGLQVKHGGVWVEHQPIHGAITVNVGDILQILSNDEYKSVEHRVVATRSRDPNISVSVFFGPSKIGDTDYYGPLPELLSSAKPALYRKFTIPEVYKETETKEAGNKVLTNLFKLEAAGKEAA